MQSGTRHKLCVLAFLLLCLSVVTGCAVEKSIRRGEQALAIGEYAEAATQFKTAYTKTPPKERQRRGQLALKQALCYDRINATQKAVAAYRNAVRYGTATPDHRLALARQLLKIPDYKGAAREAQAVLDSMPGNVLAEACLASATQAPQWKREGSRYTVKRMDVFASRRADFSPVLAGDQHDRLYFTSSRNEASGSDLSGITGAKACDIFVSEKDDRGHWKKPEAVAGGLNTDADEGATCVTPDGHEMYLTQCLTDPSYPRYARIVRSTRSDAAWGKADDVALTRDTLSSLAHPAISPDGQWLYFVSDMPGGQGGTDIWRVRITPAGFGGVENAGTLINTPGNEMFPTFRPNGDLYFSSDGRPGMGGLDIYYATTGRDGRLRIVHPGYPLNSAGDDFGMTFEGLQNRGFFASNRSDQGRGWDKIYSFDNPEIVQSVKGWVYETDGYELTQAEVYMVGNDGTNLRLNVKGDGSFEQQVEPGVDYVFLATCRGFLNHKEELSVKPTTESREHTLQFPLANIGVPTLINNILFDFDRATLKPESAVALDSLVRLLNDNPNITIELSSHCDYRGSASYNQQLSQRRAESVCRYLTDHGIAAARLTPKGYGKERPKTVRRRLAESLTWLKEGDVLTPEFIQKLTTERQDICNQLNRRTEFLVLRTTYGLFDEHGNLRLPKPKAEEKKLQSDDELFFDIP